MPSAPWLAFTCRYASHTTRLAIPNGLTDRASSSPLPSWLTRPVGTTPLLRSSPITEPSSLPPAAPPLSGASVFFLMVLSTCHFPSHHRSDFPRSPSMPVSSSCRLYTGCHYGQ